MKQIDDIFGANIQIEFSFRKVSFVIISVVFLKRAMKHETNFPPLGKTLSKRTCQSSNERSFFG